MNRAELSAATARWRSSIIAFAQECLHDPETQRPFVLYAEEQEFLRRAFTLTPDGRLPYTELCFSAGKKSGKTALAAIIAIYTALYSQPVARRDLLPGERLGTKHQPRVSSHRVDTVGISTAASQRCYRGDRDNISLNGHSHFRGRRRFKGFAGANLVLNVFDESCYFVSEASHWLWAESVPSPARKISFRLSVSTAGFESEMSPLREFVRPRDDLRQRGRARVVRARQPACASGRIARSSRRGRRRRGPTRWRARCGLRSISD